MGSEKDDGRQKNSQSPSNQGRAVGPAPGQSGTLMETVSEINVINNHGDVSTASKVSDAAMSAETTKSADETTRGEEGSSTPFFAGMVEETGELSSPYVGTIIGKGGEMIRDLQARSGCHIDVNQNVRQGAPRIITYRGRTREEIDFAKRLVAMLCTEEGTPDSRLAGLPLGKAVSKQMQVSRSAIGKIIGRGGETIRDLQSKSRARIQVDHSGDAGIDMNHRQVTVTGTQESVDLAEEMITFLSTQTGVDGRMFSMLDGERGWDAGVGGEATRSIFPSSQQQLLQGQAGMLPPPADRAVGMGSTTYWAGGFSGQTNIMGYGGYGSQHQSTWDIDQQHRDDCKPTPIETDVIPCSKKAIGHIIGRRGVTINDLQRRSSCNIQIEQQDCRVSITGPRHGIEMAKLMLQEIAERGPRHPFTGGRGYQQYESHQQLKPGQLPLPHGYVDQQQQPFHPYPFRHYGLPQDQDQYYKEQHIMYHQQQGQQWQQQPYPVQQQAQQRKYPTAAQELSPWKAATGTDGRMYYYNQNTMETRWDKPPTGMH